MSDHEFEKKVQQKMDELKLRPSDAVWAEVERNLRREKRRRRTLLWLPLMGILLTAGGYFIFNGKDEPGSEGLVKTQKAEGSDKPSASVPPSTSASPSTTDAASAKTAAEPASPSTGQSSSKNTDNPTSKNSTLSDNKITNDKPLNETPKRNKRVEKSTDPDDVVIEGKRIAKENKKVLPEVKEEKAPPAKTQFDSNAIVSYEIEERDIPFAKTAFDKTDFEGINAPSPITAKDAVKKVPVEKIPSIARWQWGITANAGVANISEGNLFDVLKSVRVEDLAGASSSYFGIPPVPTPEASPITPGVAYSVGAFIQRKFTRGFSLSVGLQYSYFTVNTKVGKFVEDTALSVNYGMLNSRLTDNYYNGVNPKYDYTNRYHFIEVPVSASMRIFNIARMPVHFDAGFSVSRLLKTNALHWDGLTRVYYENDGFFNRTQVSLNGGLKVGLLQRSRHPVWIGPNLRYFTTTLIRQEVSASGNQQHIWTFGLNAKMLLKK